jgi:hypothetical protein
VALVVRRTADIHFDRANTGIMKVLRQPLWRDEYV